MVAASQSRGDGAGTTAIAPSCKRYTTGRVSSSRRCWDPITIPTTTITSMSIWRAADRMVCAPYASDELRARRRYSVAILIAGDGELEVCFPTHDVGLNSREGRQRGRCGG